MVFFVVYIYAYDYNILELIREVFIMKKWEITNNGEFYGESGPTGIGIYAWAPNNYYLGQWDNSDRNGLAIRRYENGNVRFGMFHDGDMSYPTAIATTNGALEILFDIDSNGIEKHLYLDFDNGNWYFDTYKGDDVVGVRVVYDHSDGSIRMKNYPLGKSCNKEVVIPRHLKLDKPIIHKVPINFPEIHGFDSFDWDEGTNSAGETYTSCENSTKTEMGVGAITWGDGTFALSTWRNGGREGWNVYKWKETYSFFYLDAKLGRTIEIQVYKNSVINIADCTKDKWSCMLRYEKGNISYSYTKDNLYSREGDGFIIEDGNTVKFAKFKDHALQKVIATYKLEDTLFSGDDKEYQDQIDVLSKAPSTGTSGSGRTITPSKPARTTSGNGNISRTATFGATVSAYTNDESDKLFDGLVGLEEVKEELTKIKAYVSKNNNDDIVLNMCFLGNPGTGKELVAGIMAKILYSYGATRNEKFYAFSAKDFKTMDPGSIAEQMSKAAGGVIYVADAELLDQNDSNRDAKISLEFMINILKTYKGTRTCFIFGGSKYLIEEMLYNCYELSSQIRFRLLFPDFDKNELKQLIVLLLKQQGYESNDNATSLMVDILEQRRFAPEYANADTALEIVNGVIIAQNYRTRKDANDRTVDKKDVEKYMQDNSVFIAGSKELGISSARQELEKLVGLEEVKKNVDNLVAFFAKNRNKKVDFHMSFLGAPGTGKTEVARIVGKLLHEEGLLPTSKFIECTRDNFIGKYIGHTTPKTRELIKRAMGGVLYVDEAYTLADNSENGFGKEAIAELLKVMEDRRGEFCVILSGYTDEMKKLFQTNPGFKSRVKFELIFNDYNANEMRKIAAIFLKKDDYTITDEALDLVINVVAHLKNKPHYASARTLRETLNHVEISQAGRTRKLGIETRELTVDDVYAAFGENFVKQISSGNSKNIKPKMVKVSKLEEQYEKLGTEPFESAKARIIEAVIAIRNESEEGNSESSGFIISKDGYAVTCAHCVKNVNKLTVRVRLVHHGKNIDLNYDAQVVAVDVPNDVAVIKLISDEEFEFVSLAPVGVKDLPPLSPVFLLGYPFGFSRFDKMSINEGKVASYQRNNPTGRPDAINLDIMAKSGNSGSCVIDGATGQVIGVLCGSELSQSGSLTEEVNYCRPISFVWDLIKANQSNETEDLINLMFAD